MKADKHNTPINKTTKDDSSDVEKVKQHRLTPPSQPKASLKSKSLREDEDAQKGHA